ncbi:MAG: ribose 5-phosphate isomerase B [Clostridiales bacterium]|nr:ribose 5-phosphate isomerase B [Clostridiales bacterium]MDU1042601.1 ribose 5-phosphate isomerase B [Clostridiales bacterium]MDU3490812.1 ribose 5-phosphate isomerase B [Clostridiales bacterium]
MVAIACDHGGFELKKELIKHLEKQGIDIRDFGCDSADSCDYPDYAHLVTDAIKSGEADKGILLCGTGIGMSIAANKVEGIRAALCSDCFSAEATRLHNDTNVLCMGARVIGPELAFKIADIWLVTEFSDEERHNRRIGKIEC